MFSFPQNVAHKQNETDREQSLYFFALKLTFDRFATILNYLASENWGEEKKLSWWDPWWALSLIIFKVMHLPSRFPRGIS